LNLTHRDGHEFPEALVPGETYEVTVELDDMAHAFAPGHRIAVSLSSTYWPIAWPSPELATLTIHCGESWLDLPVRPPDPGDASLRPFDPPEAAPQTPCTYHPVAPGYPRRITRDLLSGRMQVDFPRWTNKKEMTDIGQIHISDGCAVFEIIDGDPLSAKTTAGYTVEIMRADVKTSHHSTGTMTCDASHFIIETTLVIRENDVEIFRRDWHERIPRDHI
jgi:hypothetical protein